MNKSDFQRHHCGKRFYSKDSCSKKCSRDVDSSQFTLYLTFGKIFYLQQMALTINSYFISIFLLLIIFICKRFVCGTLKMALISTFLFYFYPQIISKFCLYHINLIYRIAIGTDFLILHFLFFLLILNSIN